MTLPKSRCWKGWKRSGNGPACISAPPPSPVCTIWSMRSWTMPLTKLCRVLQAYFRHHQSRRVHHRHRRRTGHSRGYSTADWPPGLEVVYTVLHAGGKFGGGGYKVSGGLHGVGASVVNALSVWLTVRVHKNGQIYEMKFSRGISPRRCELWAAPTTPAQRSPSSRTQRFLIRSFMIMRPSTPGCERRHFKCRPVHHHPGRQRGRRTSGYHVL